MFDAPDEVIDLTNPIEDDIPVWPSYPPIDLKKTKLAARDGFTMEKLTMRTHTATHVDAPRHFVPEGKSLDDFPAEKFAGEGVVLDLAPLENAETITVEHLEPFADDIEDGDVVLLHTGWDAHYGHTPEWLFEFPHLHGEASQYLADAGAKAVGVDTPSVGGWADEMPAHGPSTDVDPADSHLPLLENDVIAIEELRNLDAVLDGAETARAFFSYLPLDLHGTSGSPVRAVAYR
ncbi:metal-dependent hydrolase [Halarchaeum acidiphilum MH1-52-1]|uniref:Metal-dependent hydrolase n=1 Tax=Halarchaeum acidiphilum MH1-52-1 TaxID=1261545 RepID=U2YFM0_9EURY|nr:cyclase family protein [Halarchaeum acidiphilum]GAD52851.1 metal-dependent hydrolase [Halarchaeum acidiphilum MH1-52-1]